MHSQDVPDIGRQTEEEQIQMVDAQVRNIVMQQSKTKNTGTKRNIAIHTMKQ